MQNKPVFVSNRLQTIARACEKCPITFSFVLGSLNPADCVTRCVSYKQLIKTNFLSGPNFDEVLDSDNSIGQEFNVTILNRMLSNDFDSNVSHENIDITESKPTSLSTSSTALDTLINPSNFSSFRHLVLIYRKVLNCARTWQLKTGIESNINTNNMFEEASKQIILADQRKHFPEVFKYFQNNAALKSNIPPIVAQLYVFVDKHGILRVKCKFKKWHSN